MRVEPQNPIMHASGTGVRLISNNLVILAWVSTAGDALKDQMNGEAGLYRTGCARRLIRYALPTLPNRNDVLTLARP